MSVRHKIYESGVLFAVAVNSAKEIQAPLRAGGQLKTLVSLIFSVVAVEAFLNEATEMAVGFLEHQSEPELISVFAESMADAESCRASLESKLALANWVLLGKKLNRGVQPYQDFALMVRLRNDLLHFKGNKEFDPNATAEMTHERFKREFGARSLLAEDMAPGSWMHAIETKAIAYWSCSTAASVVADFISKAPQSGWRKFLEAIGRHFTPPSR